MMHAQPQKEHEWLHQLIGAWTSEVESKMGPDKPTETFTAKETVRSVGGLWIVCEGQGELPGGGTATNVMTLGYDPARKRFVGTFIGSMMTHQWVYDGQLDVTGKVLTLDTEGPDFAAEGKLARYKDVIEIKSGDHRVLSAHMLGSDGKWHHFMTANYRRIK